MWERFAEKDPKEEKLKIKRMLRRQQEMKLKAQWEECTSPMWKDRQFLCCTRRGGRDGQWMQN